jgi:archaellum component FlaC
MPYLERYIRKLTGNRDIEDNLERLDNLTQEEARMASAELLKMARIVDDRVKDVDGKVQDVGNEVRAVDDRVQGIGNDVKETGSDIKGLCSDVKDMSGEVRGFDDKLDQVNRSSSFYFLLVVPRAKTAS